jgi:putative sterol carrier protein
MRKAHMYRYATRNIRGKDIDDKECGNLGIMDNMKVSLAEYLKSGIPADSGLGSDYNKTVQFEITGDDAFYVDIRGGKNLAITKGKHQKPDITIFSDSETMAGINSGDVNSMQAFMAGKIKVKGAMIELVKLQKIIFSNGLA